MVTALSFCLDTVVKECVNITRQESQRLILDLFQWR
jgi:hypothetical protein